MTLGSKREKKEKIEFQKKTSISLYFFFFKHYNLSSKIGSVKSLDRSQNTIIFQFHIPITNIFKFSFSKILSLKHKKTNLKTKVTIYTIHSLSSFHKTANSVVISFAVS